MAEETPRGSDGRFEHKLTQKLADDIIDSVRRGLFDAQNALRHGIDVTTLKSWIDRGIDEDAVEPYKDFAERYIKESIALEDSLIARILLAAEPWEAEKHSTELERKTKGFDQNEDFDCDSSDAAPGDAIRRVTKEGRETRAGDWKAAAWFLERRWPLRWGITRQPEGGPKEAIRLPEASQNRARRVKRMTAEPPPELIKAFREAGYAVVKIDADGKLGKGL